ncbi:MAG: dihydrofolate reductase [Gammaproteobacteria bacterium]|nr:dihydrofolate reductase [Gammaproteobacteria bacterium]
MIHHSIEIVHVVAMDQKNCIGVDNQLPWHLPADLQHFKRITQGGVIVMGRKTFDSLGRVLPNRSHWVLTRQNDWSHDGVHVVQTLDELIQGASTDAIARGQSSIYVIGGGELFTLTLPIADRLEITHVELDVAGAAHYPPIPEEWVKTHTESEQADEKTGVKFQFITYQKTK